MGIFDYFRKVKFGTVISKEFSPSESLYTLIVRGHVRPGGREMVKRIVVSRREWLELSVGDHYYQRNAK